MPLDKLWCAHRLWADLQVSLLLWGDSCEKGGGKSPQNILLQDCFHSREVQSENLQFSLKLEEGCGTVLVMNDWRVSSECLLMRRFCWSVASKRKILFQGGHRDMAELISRGCCTEVQKGWGKRVKDQLQMLNIMAWTQTHFFSSTSPSILYCLGGTLGKGLLCICHVSFNFSLSKSLKRQAWGGRTLYLPC